MVRKSHAQRPAPAALDSGGEESSATDDEPVSGKRPTVRFATSSRTLQRASTRTSHRSPSRSTFQRSDSHHKSALQEALSTSTGTAAVAEARRSKTSTIRRSRLRRSSSNILRGSSDDAPTEHKQASAPRRVLNKGKSTFWREFRTGAARLPFSVEEYMRMTEDDCEDPLFLQNMVTRWPMFNQASQEFIHDILNRVRLSHVDAGAEVQKGGSACKGLTFVLKGHLNLLVEDCKVGHLGRGQFFGETCLLGVEDHYAVSVVAGHGAHGHGCKLATIAQEDWVRVLSRHDALREDFDEVRRHGIILKLAQLKSIRIFRDLSENTLSRLQTLLVNRLFFPGETIIQQGDRGEDFFIIARGTVSIHVDGQVLRDIKASKDPACFGELGLLGMQLLRSASVIADTPCLAQVVHRPVFLKVLQETGDSMPLMGLEEFLSDRYSRGFLTSRQKLSEIPIFLQAGCGLEFIEYLAKRMEQRVFLRDQTIIDEEAEDTSMYILMQGAANVTQGSHVVARQGVGAVFGELTLLGIVMKRTASVVATELCLAQVLHQGAVVRALEAFPKERANVFAAAVRSARAQGFGDAASAAAPADQAPGAGPAGVDRKVLIGQVSRAPFFEGLGEEFVEKLSLQAADRIFMPGELILRQGRRGTSMFIVVSGSATIYVRPRPTRKRHQSIFEKSDVDGGFERSNHKIIKTITPGCIVGELAMLGVVNFRSSSVQADTLVLAWEVPQEAVYAVLPDFPSAERRLRAAITQNLEAAVAPRLDALPLFRAFGRNFRLLLTMNSEQRVFFPGERIVLAKRTGAGLYIMNVGEAVMKRGEKVLATYHPGCCFLAKIMLGIGRVCPCTVTATSTVHVIVVTRDNFAKALKTYPAPDEAAELVHAESRLERELQVSLKRLEMRERGAQMTSGPQHPFWEAVVDSINAGHTVKVFFETWQASARYFQEQVEHKRRQKESKAKWIQRHCEAVEERLNQEKLQVRHVGLRTDTPPEAVPWKRTAVAKQRNKREPIFPSPQSPDTQRALAPYSMEQNPARRSRSPSPPSPTPSTSAAPHEGAAPPRAGGWRGGGVGDASGRDSSSPWLATPMPQLQLPLQQRVSPEHQDDQPARSRRDNEREVKLPQVSLSARGPGDRQLKRDFLNDFVRDFLITSDPVCKTAREHKAHAARGLRWGAS